jgi:hypothetical protein
MIDQNVLTPLKNLLGPSGYRDDPAELAPWLTDWRGRYTGKAAAMVSPASTAEVAESLRLRTESLWFRRAAIAVWLLGQRLTSRAIRFCYRCAG